MKHPFTDEDMARAAEAIHTNNDPMDALTNAIVALQAAWDSAVKRGAVEENKIHRATWDNLLREWTSIDLGPHSYTIKLPEDKKP